MQQKEPYTVCGTKIKEYTVFTPFETQMLTILGASLTLLFILAYVIPRPAEGTIALALFRIVGILLGITTAGSLIAWYYSYFLAGSGLPGLIGTTIGIALAILFLRYGGPRLERWIEKKFPEKTQES